MPKYGIGDRVEHDDFGLGNVIAIDIDDWIGVEFDLPQLWFALLRLWGN